MNNILFWIVTAGAVYMVAQSVTGGHVSSPSQQGNATYMALIVTAVIVGGIYAVLKFFKKG